MILAALLTIVLATILVCPLLAAAVLQRH